jgi:flagellar biosynthesis protein FlhA
MQIFLLKLGKAFTKYTEVVIGFFVVAIIGIIIVPMPSGVLDLLLVTNISMGIIILLLTLSTKNVLQFSTFPTVLLIATMFRLALNISSTRLILSQGHAGFVINAFGEFVTGNNYIVGAVIFLIIVVVQLIVVTSGASRVSEVSARFTLDAMPGKQMAIDADLNTGLIDEDTAKTRRLNLQREADFYGSMDGASKFVKGDAIAGIVITIINLLGGILIFSLQRGLGVMEALEIFGKLTIGDGLVSQIPALLISVGAGILVTRSDDGQTFGKSVIKELFSTAQVMMVAATVLLVISLVPAFPRFPFMLVALIVGVVGYLLRENEKEMEKHALENEQMLEATAVHQELETLGNVQVEAISLEIGYGLISLVDEGRDDNLITRITSIRKQIANELGLMVNPIRVRDNLQLKPNEYIIKIKGNKVSGSEIQINRFLALDPGSDEIDIKGTKTQEPSFGMDAFWVDEEEKNRLELHGVTIVEPGTIFITHLKETIKTHAPALLGRQELKQILDSIKEEYPVVIDELIPDLMTLGEVQKVLQKLLNENVPINDMVTILEALADNATVNKDVEYLTEQVRYALKRTIVKNHTNGRGVLEVLTIHPDLEELISGSIKKTMSGAMPILKPDAVTRVLDSVSNSLNSSMMKGYEPVVLTSPKIRSAFKNLIDFNFPSVPILSITEIPRDVEIEAVGLIE